MKTNIGIETSDEERLIIGQTLGTGKMVKRDELKEAINGYVSALASGWDPCQAGRETREKVAEAPGRACDGQDRPEQGNRSTREFVPSRGDEPYLLKAKDPELRDILSRMLDVSEEYEAYVWRKHNENRIDEPKSFPRGD